MEVFQPALDIYASGATPNPDISCNREIKFGGLFKRLKSVTSSERWWLATGSLRFTQRLKFRSLRKEREMCKDRETCPITFKGPEQRSNVLFITDIPYCFSANDFSLGTLYKTENSRISEILSSATHCPESRISRVMFCRALLWTTFLYLSQGISP
jgi:tRNA methyl transferase